MKKRLLVLLVVLISFAGFGQSSGKMQKNFADPIITDSLSTIMIPVTYDNSILNSSKISYYDNYANIIFYNFKNDSYKKLFNEDTFIKEFVNRYDYYDNSRNNKVDYICQKWILYLVKNKDYNKNGKIDNNDPYILYVSDRYGNGLKSITPENENAVSLKILDKQGFALIKMQRDLDKDTDFESDDKDYYYIRLDLNTLTLGNTIEF